MRKFIEMIQTMTKENFETALNRIVFRQTICAFFSAEPAEISLQFIAKIRRENNVNVRALITLSDSSEKELVGDIEVVDFKNFSLLKPSPAVIFVADDLEYKIASSYLDDDIEIINWSKRIQRTIDSYKTYMNHIADLYDVYDSFIDEDSKRVFRGFLLAKVSSKLSYAVYSNTPHYICPGFLPKSGDIFIDGGAYDGGTAKRFYNMGCKVVGFEMDKYNYAAANKTSEKIKLWGGG